jgi:hypothetical protein
MEEIGLCMRNLEMNMMQDAMNIPIWFLELQRSSPNLRGPTYKVGGGGIQKKRAIESALINPCRFFFFYFTGFLLSGTP